MPTPARNIGIAQPRSHPRRPQLSKTIDATFKNKDSVMNSHFYNMFGLFGSANSTNRKQYVYTSNDSVSTGTQEIRQSNLEANVGQMDRLNRIKALNIRNSK